MSNIEALTIGIIPRHIEISELFVDTVLANKEKLCLLEENTFSIINNSGGHDIIKIVHDCDDVLSYPPFVFETPERQYTEITIKKSDTSIAIVKEIVSRFGGYIDEDTNGDTPWYYIKRIEITPHAPGTVGYIDASITSLKAIISFLTSEYSDVKRLHHLNTSKYDYISFKKSNETKESIYTLSVTCNHGRYKLYIYSNNTGGDDAHDVLCNIMTNLIKWNPSRMLEVRYKKNN